MNGVVTVIQARMGSSRLPGKVLLPLGDSTVLEQMLVRVRRAHLAGSVVVATTTDPADDVIASLCARIGADYVRGSRDDLLDRHYQVARHFQARHLVKIPSDCSLIDPAIIDHVVGYYLATSGQFDYVSNLHPEHYPDGNDVEVMPVEALALAWREARRPYEREHTTPFLWDQPERFRLGNVTGPGSDLSRVFRYVLDYPEDYEVIRRIFDGLDPNNPRFGVQEIVAFLNRFPEVAELNARHRGVNWYRHHLDQLSTVGPGQALVSEEPPCHT